MIRRKNISTNKQRHDIVFYVSRFINFIHKFPRWFTILILFGTQSFKNMIHYLSIDFLLNVLQNNIIHFFTKHAKYFALCFNYD